MHDFKWSLTGFFVFWKRIRYVSTCLCVLGAGTLNCYSFCTIRGIRRLSDSTCLYELEFDRPSRHFENLPIQSVLLKNSDMQIQRCYTPLFLGASSVVLLVKYYKDGEMSRWIHRKRVGDLIELRGPFLEWAWDKNRWKRVLFIAGGTGIAPAYQLLSYVFQDSNKQIPEFHVMYANRSPDEILLKEELDRLQEKYPTKLKITYFVDTCPEDKVSNEYFTRMISLHDIKQAFVPSVHSDPSTIVLVCGTDGFVNYIAGPNGILHGEQGSRGGLIEKTNYVNVWKL
ncbi:hypothetical protein PORY_001658 [Pneumocystis oryctolagi]|uniref:Uncharacterized protein n=1 Tax=Pneumocystis oryctolagi TaxID=42067 RepID=A0ACB7CDE5_9ASCO|nr:hypothetical protein PORY_001658 [Pneumocystis oryctolagi]